MKALALIVLMALPGCTITRGDWSVSAFQLAPGDDIQTSTMTVIGLAIMPSEAAVYLGYVRAQANRIPSYDQATIVPDVAITTNVGEGPFVTETLAVGQLTEEAEKKSFWDRLRGK